MQAELLADSYVSLAAFAGLAIFARPVAAGAAANPLAPRILFGIAVLAVLVLSRVLFWHSGLWPFRFASLAAAALIPLAALLWAEGLLRRHAPRGFKHFVAWGAGLFIALAFLPAERLDPLRITALFGFQFLALLGIGGLVLRRDKAGLSAAENRAVERIGLSLVLIVPFLITDYRLDSVPVPVRLGGIAMLFLCWLGLSLSRATTSHRDALRAAFVLAAAAIMAGLALAGMAGLAGRGVVQAVAIVLASGLVAAIHDESQHLAGEARRDSLLRHLATGDIASSAQFLGGLRAHPLAAGALLLRADDLADLDLGLLQKSFAHQPLWAAGQVSAEPDTACREQLAFLFERFEATHVLLVAEHPFALLTLAMPHLMQAPGAQTELEVVSRMAVLIARIEAAPAPAATPEQSR